MGFPLWLQAAIGSIARWAFTAVASYFVGKGVWTNEEASGYVTAAALAVIPLLWSLWEKRGALKRYFTALAAPAGTTDAEARTLVSEGAAPPATLAQHVSPYLETKK